MLKLNFTPKPENMVLSNIKLFYSGNQIAMNIQRKQNQIYF